MLTLRKSQDRGTGSHDWLQTFHTFSFAEYHDPDFMGFGKLRVINEDTIAAGQGFNRHPHNNMEIITYVVQGTLAHQDSMGNGSIIKPGEIQIMSAGTGVEHSEFNYSKTEPLHLLQIWIIPDTRGLTPNYQQKTIEQKQNSLILIASREPQDNAVIIQQDIKLFTAHMTADHTIDYAFNRERMGWLQLIKGKLDVNGQAMSAGDGIAIQDEQHIAIKCNDDAEFLLFDLI